MTAEWCGWSELRRWIYARNRLTNEPRLFAFHLFLQFCWNPFTACIRKLQYFTLKCTSGQESLYLPRRMRKFWFSWLGMGDNSNQITTMEPTTVPSHLKMGLPGYLHSREQQIFPPGCYTILSSIIKILTLPLWSWWRDLQMFRWNSSFGLYAAKYILTLCHWKH